MAPPVSSRDRRRRGTCRAAVAVALGAFAFAPSTAHAQDRLTNNRFSLDLFQGPILAPISILGVAGAYSPYAEGISGFVSNAASPAVREPFSFSYIDGDASVSVSIPLPLFQNDDFDDSGSRDKNYSNFVYVTSGGLVQIGALGFGVNAEIQHYALAAEGGSTTGVNVGKFKALAAVRLLGDQFMVGGGLRVVVLQIVSEDVSLAEAGLAPEVGFLIRPDWQPFRVGGTFRAPVDGGAFIGHAPSQNGVERAGDLVLPDHVVQPWELQFGVAVQVGPRPLNPKWIDPHDQEAGLRAILAARRADRMRAYAEELALIPDPVRRAERADEMEVEEDAIQAREAAEFAVGKKTLDRERRARYANWPREHFLFLADILLTGAVTNGVSVPDFLGQNEPTTARYDPSILLGPKFREPLVGTSGATVSFSPRLGVETEPVPDYIHTRAGSYYEPARYTARDIGRQHFTFGSDLKLFSTHWFGLTHETFYKLQASGDFAARYQSISLGLGVWH